MPVQYATVLFNNLLGASLDSFARLAAPIAGVLLIAAGIFVYETLGNSRTPGSWR